MKQLFLRIYLGMLATLILSAFVMNLLIVHEWKLDLINEHSQYIESMHPRIVATLQVSPPDRWRELLDEWEEITDYGLEMQTLSDTVGRDGQHVTPQSDSLVIDSTVNYITEYQYLWATYRIPGTDQALSYTYESSESVGYQVSVIVGWIVLITAIAIVTYFLIRPIYRATQALSVSAAQYAQGALHERVEVSGRGPFAELGRQFNRMAEDIQKRIEEQRVMTHAIPHELKTPITRLRLALDMAATKDDLESIRELLVEMDTDLDDLDGLTTQLLALAKITYSDQPIELKPIRVADIIEAEMENLRPLRPDLKMTLRGDTQLYSRGDEDLLARAFHNLLANGQRYAKQGVAIELGLEDQNVVITVDDDGPGIPEVQRMEIFTPFARLDHSRTRNTGGTGLGLAIVRQSVERQQGSIEVGDSPQGGTRFLLRFPSA
jgi:two-component system sensor histidine kinase RstB